MALPIVREVANLERYSLARANAGVYYNVVVGTRLHQQLPDHTLPTDKAHWIELLTGPLTWLVQQHPVLSVVLGDHLSAKPTFLRMPSIDLTRLIRVTSISHPTDIAQVLDHEHNLPFDLLDVEVPLWRIIVVHVAEDDSFFLLYNFQHVIGDGRSALALTEQLVERLNIQAAERGSSSSSSPELGQTTLSAAIVPPNKPLPLPMEKRTNCKPSVPTLLKEATMALLLPAFVKKALESKYWAGDIDATLDKPNETQTGMWYLNQDETKQVIQAAKKRKTTVQSILFTASCFAAKAVFLSKVDANVEPTTTEDKLCYATPVSLRQFTSPPIAAEDQGSYTSELVTRDIQVGLNTGFWDLTQSYRKQVIHGTTTSGGIGAMLEHAGLLDYLPKHQGGWEEFLKGQVSKEQHGRLATLKLSNIGKAWDQPDRGPKEVYYYRVEDALFSQSASITGSAVTLNAATANGILSMTGTWQKAAFVGRDRADLFMKEFQRILLQATECSRENYFFREALLPSH